MWNYCVLFLEYIFFVFVWVFWVEYSVLLMKVMLIDWDGWMNGNWFVDWSGKKVESYGGLMGWGMFVVNLEGSWEYGVVVSSCLLIF